MAGEIDLRTVDRHRDTRVESLIPELSVPTLLAASAVLEAEA